MAKCGYSIVTPWVNLSAATAKTVLQVMAPAGHGLEVKKLRIGLNGTSASEVPGVVELTGITTAGTGTAATPQQIYGRPIPHGLSAAYNLTAEPDSGAAIPLDAHPLTPYSGLVIYDYPLGDSPDCAPENGFGVRADFPATVQIMATMWVERI